MEAATNQRSGVSPRALHSSTQLCSTLSTSGSYNLTSVQYTGRAMGQSSLLTLPSCRAETHILSLYLKLKHITH